jgi:hypothetical protein
VHRQIFIPMRVERICSGIVPNIRPIAAVSTELDIIDVPRCPVFEDEDKLVL